MFNELFSTLFIFCWLLLLPKLLNIWLLFKLLVNIFDLFKFDAKGLLIFVFWLLFEETKLLELLLSLIFKLEKFSLRLLLNKLLLLFLLLKDIHYIFNLTFIITSISKILFIINRN